MLGIHPERHRGASAERGEQQAERRRPGILAAQRLRLVGDDRMATDIDRHRTAHVFNMCRCPGQGEVWFADHIFSRGSAHNVVDAGGTGSSGKGMNPVSPAPGSFMRPDFQSADIAAACTTPPRRPPDDLPLRRASMKVRHRPR